MFSLFSKKLSEVNELKSVLPADLSGAVVSAEKAVTGWLSKIFPFLTKKTSSLPGMSAMDLSGTVASAEEALENVAKGWFSRLWPSPAPAPVLKIAKNDLVIVTVSLPSVWTCNQYDLKVAVSLPELVKPVRAPAVPEPVAVVPEPVAADNLQIYDSIEKVLPPTPPQSIQTSPESEKNEVAEQNQDKPPE
jgi:hypothetical protein